jgi:MFS family permease
MFGNGVVVPFLVIYLHNVRGISLGLAGSIAAANGLAALVSGPAAGTLADRLGARTTLVGALVLMTVSFSLFPLIHEAWHAFLLNGLAGFGSGAFWPSQGALLSSLTPPPRRPAAFAQQRVTMNLGVGLGGLAGGLIARTGDPASFTVLFLLDAATFLAFVGVLSRVPRPARADASSSADVRLGGYREVFRNRAFLGVLLLNVALTGAGIAPLVELLPVFAKNQASVSERGIGLVFFLNTLAIVVAQLPIAKLEEGRRRMRAVAHLCLIWAASWLVVLATGLWLRAGAATALLGFALLVFAIGECLHGPIWGPIVADLAPARLTGRYMALSSLSWTFGFMIGPAAGGFILGAEPYALWPVCAAACLAAGAYALALEQRLPPDVRRTPRPAQAVPAALPEGVAAGSSG